MYTAAALKLPKYRQYRGFDILILHSQPTSSSSWSCEGYCVYGIEANKFLRISPTFRRGLQFWERKKDVYSQQFRVQTSVTWFLLQSS